MSLMMSRKGSVTKVIHSYYFTNLILSLHSYYWFTFINTFLYLTARLICLHIWCYAKARSWERHSMEVKLLLLHSLRVLHFSKIYVSSKLSTLFRLYHISKCTDLWSYLKDPF